MNLRELRDWTAHLVDKAANHAVQLLQAGTQTHFKADGTIVTDVDRATEQFLRQAIGAAFPEHAILGEEYGYEEKDNVPLWAIDPVDGTVNFANGLPSWCVSVALLVNRIPVLGVINAPQLRQAFVGAEGHGVTLNGQSLATLPSGAPLTWEDTYGICTNSARVVDFSDLPCRLRISGSAALDLAYAAAGWTKGCQSISTSLWDVAAGIALCRELGASTEWYTGETWTPETMLSGNYRDNILLTAPPKTRAFIRDRIHKRV
jgi:fructose-1,6-bisphosphatase/inositol monophosphatase family enzyme